MTWRDKSECLVTNSRHFYYFIVRKNYSGWNKHIHSHTHAHKIYVHMYKMVNGIKRGNTVVWIKISCLLCVKWWNLLYLIEPMTLSNKSERQRPRTRDTFYYFIVREKYSGSKKYTHKHTHTKDLTDPLVRNFFNVGIVRAAAWAMVAPFMS